MTRIGLIRHGTTAWNKERRAQGSADIPLDNDGLVEARHLAERLSLEDWDVIYSSHLKRAEQTAEIIKEMTSSIPLHIDQRLREVSGGLIEGTTKEERIKKWGENWHEMDLGIEASQDAVTRGLAALDEIAIKHPGQNVLVVSHGSLLSHLLQALVPELDRTAFLNNTSLTVLKTTEGSWEAEFYNCTRHLIKV